MDDACTAVGPGLALVVDSDGRVIDVIVDPSDVSEIQEAAE